MSFVRAKFAYTAQTNDGISLLEGDRIQVTQKDQSGWWKGVCIRDGSAGWFPASYVTEEVRPCRSVLKFKAPPAPAQPVIQLSGGGGESTTDGEWFDAVMVIARSTATSLEAA